MGMFANAMGNDCTYCHAPTAALDRTAFAVATPRIQRARQMIVMMNAINKTLLRRTASRDLLHLPWREPESSKRSQYRPSVQHAAGGSERARFPYGSDGLGRSDLRQLPPGGGRRGAAGRRSSSFIAKGTYCGVRHRVREGAGGDLREGAQSYATIVHMSAGDSLRDLSTAATGGSAGRTPPCR